MCGIAGFLSLDRAEAPSAGVRRMLPLLERRGPDSAGMHEWPGVSFGHRRLAIFDLSPAGHQPMLSDDGRLGVVFNGSIYNFLELRADLEKAGHRFRSRCDTEVLLAGYREWGGRGMVEKLRGMFAFAIWDEDERKLTLARDRMGVKPLLYWTQGRRLAFASSLAALRAGVQPETAGAMSDLDADSVAGLIEYGFLIEPRSIYRDVGKIGPATIAEWRDGKLTQQVYWTLPEHEEAAPARRFEDVLDETESLFLEAVRLRLQADVPVGALLSGGVDSTLVCWAMAKLNANLRVFTVSTPDEPEDEAAAARQTAQLLGVPHEIVPMPPASEMRFPLPGLFDAYSEPLASASALGMLQVSQAVKNTATVLLTGDGGDDIYLGYDFFHNAWRAERLARRLPAVAPALWRLARPLTHLSGRFAPARNFLNYVTGGVGEYARVHAGFPYLERHGAFGPRLRAARLAEREIPASFDSARRLLSDAIGLHWKLHFTGEFMAKVDGATTHYALEARAPFLDHVLWEHAARLSPEIRLRGGEHKAVLRAIARRRVSPEVASRRKQGFVIPLYRWLVTRWAEELRSLRQGELVRQGWLDEAGVGRAIDEAIARGRAPETLWHLLVLDHWLAARGAAAAAPVEARDVVVTSTPVR